VTVLRELRDCLLEAILVVGDALRMVWRHWPALISIFLLGLAARNAAMWAAVVVGREHVVLASLIVPLAPFSMIIALVLMLRTVWPSARWARKVTEGTPRERLAVLASALVPFLTVYALQGHLKEDRFQFINDSFAEEKRLGSAFTDAGLADRTLADIPTWQVGLIIVVAFLIRSALDRLRLADRHVSWGFLAALVEVTWMTWVASLITSHWRDARDWAGELVVAAEAADAWQRVTAALGPLTEPVREVGDLLGSIVDGIGAIVVTPLAWLAVGAVVLAGGLDASRRARIEEHAAVLEVRARMQQRLHRVPRPQLIVKVLSERFSSLISGLRIIAHAGLLPVLSFCLLLGLAQLAEWGTELALRSAIGPGDPLLMLSLSPYVAGASRTVYTVVVVVLVAAAVDRLLARRLHEEQPEAVAEPPAAVTA
jgi:hypothetical protein